MSVKYALFLHALSINMSTSTLPISADTSYTNRIARPNRASLDLPHVAITLVLLVEATVAALAVAAGMAQLVVQAAVPVVAVKSMSPTFVAMHSISSLCSTIC